MNNSKLLAVMDYLAVAITILTFVFSVGSAISGTVNPNHYTFVAISGLVFPATILFSFVIFLYWALRRSYLILFPLVSLLINFGPIFSNFQFRQENNISPFPGNQKLAVASYNIHKFKYDEQSVSTYEISEYLKSENIQIACFQEFGTNTDMPMREALAFFDYLPYKAIKEYSDDEMGMAIMSKYPIIKFDKITFEDTGNGILWADIKLPDRKVVRVVNCHLQTTNYNQTKTMNLNVKLAFIKANILYRTFQAETVKLLTDTTTTPIIVCGDFNDQPTSYTYSTIKGDKLVDGFREAGSWLGGTYKYFWGIPRVDYIFHSKHFKSLQYKSDKKEWSDHNPVISVLEFKN